MPQARLTRATPLYSATGQTVQSLGVAVLATILSGAVTVALPKGIGAGGGLGELSRLPAPARAAAEAGLRQFQGQYLTGFERAYLAAFIVSIVATVLALFLPGWPGAYRRRAASGDATSAPGDDAGAADGTAGDTTIPAAQSAIVPAGGVAGA